MLVLLQADPRLADARALRAALDVRFRARVRERVRLRVGGGLSWLRLGRGGRWGGCWERGWRVRQARGHGEEGVADGEEEGGEVEEGVEDECGEVGGEGVGACCR